MRVGRFFVTLNRKPRRVWWLHCMEAKPVPPETEAYNASVCIYDPLWEGFESDKLPFEVNHLLGWIGERRLAGDPPATEILLTLWPRDKRKLDEVLNNMAIEELLGRQHENQDANP